MMDTEGGHVAMSSSTSRSSAKQEADFILSGCNAQDAVKFRERLLVGMMTYAFNDIYIHCNESHAHDLHLSAQLIKLPLIMSDDAAEEWTNASEAARLARKEATFEFLIDVSCPLDHYEESLAVSSNDILPSKSTHSNAMNDDAAIVWPTPMKNIPILKLHRGQSLKVTLSARLGSGKEHSKWSPTCAVSVRKRPFVEVATERLNTLLNTPAKRRYFLNSCRRGVFSVLNPNDEYSEWIKPASFYSDDEIMAHDIGIENAAAMDRCVSCMVCTNMIGLEEKVVRVGLYEDQHIVHVTGKPNANLDRVLSSSLLWLKRRLDEKARLLHAVDDKQGEDAIGQSASTFSGHTPPTITYR